MNILIISTSSYEKFHLKKRLSDPIKALKGCFMLTFAFIEIEFIKKLISEG